MKGGGFVRVESEKAPSRFGHTLEILSLFDQDLPFWGLLLFGGQNEQGLCNDTLICYQG